MKYSVIKSIADFFFAVILILLTLPFQLLIAILIFIQLRESPLFFQKRGICLEKDQFTIIKFKTIKTSHAEKVEHQKSKDVFLIQKFLFSLTYFTEWLRKSGLDELPQLYNVLAGQMSLVGPRPLMLRDLEIMKNEFPKQYKKRTLLKSKPGITGLWQLFGNRNLGVENLLGLDLFYENSRSLKMDFKIALYTIPIMLFAKNNDSAAPRIELMGNLFSLKLEKFVYENSAKQHSKQIKGYTLNLPVDWWQSNDSYNSQQRKKSKIFQINSQKKFISGGK